MKYILLLLLSLPGFHAASQDKNVTYLKFECSGVKYSHKDSLSGKWVMDQTIKKNVTIYLDKEQLSHIIIKEGSKTLRYKTTGTRQAPEEALGYQYRIDDHFMFEVLILLDDKRKLLRGYKGGVGFDYVVSGVDLGYRVGE